MVEERITETRTPEGNTHTTHTLVSDRAESGGGAKWVLVILLLVAVVAGVVFFSQASDAEIAKDNAIAGAAEDVGNAASQVGDAAQQAGEAAQDAVQQ